MWLSRKLVGWWITGTRPLATEMHLSCRQNPTWETEFTLQRTEASKKHFQITRLYTSAYTMLHVDCISIKPEERKHFYTANDSYDTEVLCQCCPDRC